VFYCGVGVPVGRDEGAAWLSGAWAQRSAWPRREAHGRGGVGAWVQRSAWPRWGGGHRRREAHGRGGAGGTGAQWSGGIGPA